MDPSVSLPLGWFASAARQLMPPVIEFGAAVERARTARESFPHIPIRVHPRLWRRVGPATLPYCRASLELYGGDAVVRSIPLCWSDMQNAEPPQDEIMLRRYRPFLLPIAWRSEIEEGCVGYFTDARFVRNETVRLIPIVDKSRFKLRVVSGSSEWVSPHYYLARCPNVGDSNNLFSVQIEYEGLGTRATQEMHGSPRATGANPIEIIFDENDARCVRKHSHDDGASMFWMGIRNNTPDSRSILDVTLRGDESMFFREVVLAAMGGRGLVVREWSKLDPGGTEWFQLFGINPTASRPEAIETIRGVHRFTMEVRATNTKASTICLEFDIDQTSPLRRVAE